MGTLSQSNNYYKIYDCGHSVADCGVKPDPLIIEDKGLAKAFWIPLGKPWASGLWKEFASGEERWLCGREGFCPHDCR